MTKAKAATVASALIAAGYLITLQRLSEDSYVITATADAIDAQTAATFAAGQSVTATVQAVKLF
jgi:hypothetical protein